ncbi:MAG: hypothetical protein ACRC7V_04625 [Lachnospiraceae bacterium]
MIGQIGTMIGNANTTKKTQEKVAVKTEMGTKGEVIKPEAVQLSISDEAKEKLENMQESLKNMSEEASFVGGNNFEDLQKVEEAEGENLRNQGKILEIARRISKGGHVPAIDEKKLMEYSPKMYQMAKQAAMLATQHKKYKKALFEEKDSKSIEEQEKIETIQQEEIVDEQQTQVDEVESELEMEM